MLSKSNLRGFLISYKDNETQNVEHMPSFLNTSSFNFQPSLSYIIYILTGTVGVLTHYLLPQLRKQLPWLFVASPVLKSYEYNLYEWQGLFNLKCSLYLMKNFRILVMICSFNLTLTLNKLRFYGS